MKMRSSTKILATFVTVALVAYFGWGFYSSYRVSQMKFSEIKPGTINLVGIDTSKGFQIIVANRVAQLVQGAPGKMQSVGSTDADTEKRRVPIRELLASLSGDEVAMGAFTAIVNKLSEDDLPPIRVIWTEDNLKKAFVGDVALKKKLESDINMTVDGMPLPELRPSSLENGIVIEVPVPVEVTVAGEKKTLVGKVLLPYKPKLMKQVEARYADKPQVTKEMQAGYYQEEASAMIKAKAPEDIRRQISAIFSSDQKNTYATQAKLIIDAAKVVVNNDQIESAELIENDGAKGKVYTIRMHMTSEGADRLWQYSKSKVGSQLLLIENGIAIAAPMIEHELSQRVLEIDKLEDRVLAQQAVDTMNRRKAS